MAQVSGTEEERRAAILEQRRKWDIDLHGMTIEGTLYRTDADMQHKGNRYALKNDIGSTGAEPNAQIAAYYLESTRRRAVDYPNSPLLCFLLYIFSEDLRFSFPHVVQTIIVRPVYWLWWCSMEPSLCKSFLPFSRCTSIIPMVSCGRLLHDTLPPCEKQFVRCNTLPTINDRLNISPAQASYPYVTSFLSLKDSTKEKFSYFSQLGETDIIIISTISITESHWYYRLPFNN